MICSRLSEPRYGGGSSPTIRGSSHIYCPFKNSWWQFSWLEAQMQVTSLIGNHTHGGILMVKYILIDFKIKKQKFRTNWISDKPIFRINIQYPKFLIPYISYCFCLKFFFLSEICPKNVRNRGNAACTKNESTLYFKNRTVSYKSAYPKLKKPPKLPKSSKNTIQRNFRKPKDKTFL